MIENRSFFVVSYHSKSEVYELKASQFVLHKSLPYAVKAIHSYHDDTLLFSSTSAISFGSSSTMLTFPAPAQFIKCYEDLIIVASRNHFFIYTLNGECIVSQQFEHDISSLSLHPFNSILLHFLFIRCTLCGSCSMDDQFPLYFYLLQ